MSCSLVHSRVGARPAFAGCPLSVRRAPAVQAPRTLVIENAHKKGAGSTKNGRDSNSKSRGVKVYGGQPVVHGGIIVRQVGNTFHAGINVGTGKDYTLFSLSEGVVVYETIKQRSCISVYPAGDPKTAGLQLPKQENSRATKRLAHWKGVTRGSKPAVAAVV